MMTQPSGAVTKSLSRNHSGDRQTLAATETAVQPLLEAMADVDCRRILEMTSGTPKTAPEIADDCNLPYSTTYRKLDRLTEVGLLNERLRVDATGHQPTEYFLANDEIMVSIKDGGEVSVRLG